MLHVKLNEDDVFGPFSGHLSINADVILLIFFSPIALPEIQILSGCDNIQPKLYSNVT